MAKRPKCEHGNATWQINGCAHCVMRLTSGGALLKGLNVEADHLLALILKTWPTQEVFTAAANAAFAEVEQQAAAREKA